MSVQAASRAVSDASRAGSEVRTLPWTDFPSCRGACQELSMFRTGGQALAGRGRACMRGPAHPPRKCP